MKEANKQKYEMEGLNEKCEVLMEHSACSHVRDHAVNAQAAYANLYATVQGLLSRTEKSVADLTDFNRMRAEFDEWFARANGTAQDAALFFSRRRRTSRGVQNALRTLPDGKGEWLTGRP